MRACIRLAGAASERRRPARISFVLSVSKDGCPSSRLLTWDRPASGEPHDVQIQVGTYVMNVGRYCPYMQEDENMELGAFSTRLTVQDSLSFMRYSTKSSGLRLSVDDPSQNWQVRQARRLHDWTVPGDVREEHTNLQARLALSKLRRSILLQTCVSCSGG